MSRARKRPKLSPGQLYTLLKEEFAARRPPGCPTCQMPLAYSVAPADEVSANWRIGTPTECSRKCHHVIAEIYLELAARYDLVEYASDTDRVA